MDDARFADLTEPQRACLRLVLMGKTSKQIARALGISEDTADQRIAAARRKLGAADRSEAARALAAYEGAEPYRTLIYGQPVYPSPDVAAGPPPSTQARPTKNGVGQQGGRGDLLKEDQAPYEAGPQGRYKPFPWPLPQKGRQENDLSGWQRLGWILVIATAAALMLGGLASGSVSTMEALSKLF